MVEYGISSRVLNKGIGNVDYEQEINKTSFLHLLNKLIMK
jgi:hypothetical protein